MKTIILIFVCAFLLFCGVTAILILSKKEPKVLVYKKHTNDSVLNRYFLVSYNFEDGKESGYGHVSFVSVGFPSEKKLDSTIGFQKIVIQSIYEFKNKQDYDNFNK